MKILFSVLSYYPSFITNESINIGILFHNITTDTRRLETTSNWNRVSKFDDEIDIDYLKLLLEGIKREISNDNLFNYKEVFNLKKYTQFYVNELKFSEPTYAEDDNFEEFIVDTKQIFLRYDFAKNERPDHNKQIKYIKNLMNLNKIEYSNAPVQGTHYENVTYNYIIDEYAFKLFTFENRRISYLVSTAKSWAYTANEMKSKYKTIFIYDVDLEDSYFKSVIEILSSAAYKVMKIDEALEFVMELKKKSQLHKNEFITNKIKEA